MLTGIFSALSVAHARTPALPNGSLMTTCGSIAESSRPSRIIPSTSVAITSALTGPLTIWQIRLVISRGSPFSFAISDGLVVTPSTMPRATNDSMSCRLPVSRKIFMRLSPILHRIGEFADAGHANREDVAGGERPDPRRRPRRDDVARQQRHDS